MSEHNEALGCIHPLDPGKECKICAERQCDFGIAEQPARLASSARGRAETLIIILRAASDPEFGVPLSRKLYGQAADEIERLCKALQPFAEAVDALDDSARDTDHLWESGAAMGLTAGNLRAARASLQSDNTGR